jgi:hypothetical protein
MSAVPQIKLVTFGRLNPGTPGHLALIQAMIDQAIIYISERTGLPEIYFLLSKTQGGPDNPFECDNNDSQVTQITKKNLFISMIASMVNINYSQYRFNINKIIFNSNNPEPAIIINVECSSNIFQAFPGIITEPENTMVHLFFGSDQDEFADTIKDNLTKKTPPILTVKSIVTRATVGDGIDIKTLPIEEICKIIQNTPYPELGSLCSSSMVKKLVKANTPATCRAIDMIYNPYLDTCTIDEMRTQLHGVLTTEYVPTKKGKTVTADPTITAVETVITRESTSDGKKRKYGKKIEGGKRMKTRKTKRKTKRKNKRNKKQSKRR